MCHEPEMTHKPKISSWIRWRAKLTADITTEENTTRLPLSPRSHTFHSFIQLNPLFPFLLRWLLNFLTVSLSRTRLAFSSVSHIV